MKHRGPISKESLALGSPTFEFIQFSLGVLQQHLLLRHPGLLDEATKDTPHSQQLALSIFHQLQALERLLPAYLNAIERQSRR